MSFDGLLFTERPSSLRLQGFTPLGQRLFDMAARGEIARLRIDHDHRYFEGTIDALGDGLQLPALPQLLELMASVTFAPPDLSQRVEMRRADGDASIMLSFYVGGGEQRQLTRTIVLDRRRLPVEETWYDAAGAWTARVAYRDYYATAQRWQPRRVLAHLRGDVEIKVTIRELQLDPVWTPGDFDVPRLADVSARR